MVTLVEDSDKRKSQREGNMYFDIYSRKAEVNKAAYTAELSCVVGQEQYCKFVNFTA